MADYKVTIYTDGSCINNPGSGGIGIVMFIDKDGKRYIKKISKHYPKYVKMSEDSREFELFSQGKKKGPVEIEGKYYAETTNNRMELLAIIRALEALKYPERTDVFLYSDSQWALNMAKGLWNPKENIDLVTFSNALVRLCEKIEFQWVKGHVGNKYNEECNSAALWAAQQREGEWIESRVEEIGGRKK